jgi:hypothetical protein
LATAIGKGASGDAKSAAVSGSITAGSLVTAASANADAPVAGTSTAKTWAAIGNGAIAAPALVADEAVAQITAEPRTADVHTINTSNPNIKAAFTTGKTPTYFGVAELGGAYSTSGSGSETETSSVHMTVDLTKMASLHDLIIGFYSGTAAGAGFTSMSLDLKINGTDHINNFATVADANTFFQNHAVDYGALTGTSLQLDISLAITETAAGGYDFGMLIGDPPPALAGAQPHAGAPINQLAQAMTSFGGGGDGGSTSPFEAMQTRDHHHHALLATHAT